MPSTPTRRFGFLMFPKYEELDLIGPWEMATMWRDYAISEHGGPVTCAKGLKSVADVAFADCPPLDYLLVPGGFSAFDEMHNDALITFVRERAAKASHVLSVCTGSFILSAAGLLKGRCATTHWKALDQMRKLPSVTVVEQRWVRDGNIWTSAGVSAGMDLLLGFIETVDGTKAAGSVQMNAEYYPDGRIYGETTHPAATG
jgi:transcriptional regulator GlxA family with amidase domain